VHSPEKPPRIPRRQCSIRKARSLTDRLIDNSILEGAFPIAQAAANAIEGAAVGYCLVFCSMCTRVLTAEKRRLRRSRDRHEFGTSGLFIHANRRFDLTSVGRGQCNSIKLDGKCDEAHNDLIRHHGMSPVTTSLELYHVLSQLGHCFEAIFQLNRAAFYA
jgi:hypothetical protein